MPWVAGNNRRAGCKRGSGQLVHEHRYRVVCARADPTENDLHEDHEHEDIDNQFQQLGGR